jgi:chemotaxis protein histidine kinase CheA
MSTADAFKQQLLQLSADYRAMLPAKLAEIDTLWQQLAPGAEQPQACRDLLRELHTLAGSAKTFGFPGVSTAAREAELFLEPFCEKGAIPQASDRDALVRLLDALRQNAAA